MSQLTIYVYYAVLAILFIVLISLIVREIIHHRKHMKSLEEGELNDDKEDSNLKESDQNISSNESTEIPVIEEVTEIEPTLRIESPEIQNIEKPQTELTNETDNIKNEEFKEDNQILTEEDFAKDDEIGGFFTDEKPVTIKEENNPTMPDSKISPKKATTKTKKKNKKNSRNTN